MSSRSPYRVEVPQYPSKPSRYPRPSAHDGLAVVSFVLAWFFPIIGLILGIVSVNAAHQAGRKASGLAVAAIVLGGIATFMIVVLVAAAVR